MKKAQLLILIYLQILEFSKSLKNFSVNETLQIDEVNISLELENDDIQLIKKINREIKGLELIFKHRSVIFNVKKASDVKN